MSQLEARAAASTQCLRTAFSSFAALSPDDRAGWRELASQAGDDAPFVDEAWLRSWTEAFDAPEPVLLCSWQEGRLVGLAALHTLREWWWGRTIPVLQSATNVESSRFGFASLHGRQDIQERLFRALIEAGQWDVLRLDYLAEGSTTLLAGLRVAAELGWRTALEKTFESPWRSLPQLPLPWDHGLTRKFKANLRNRERRLQALGRVSFDVITGRENLRQAAEVFYGLEASGWKGTRGTAIASRRAVRALYDQLLERAGEDMWIPVLSVADRPVAAQLVRVRGRTLFMLKTAYHPDFHPYSPGQLLTARLVRYGIAHGMEVLDFLADNMIWKSDWAPSLRRHFRLCLFSPSASGRYAYWTRYGIREQVKRLPGATRFVRWLRAPAR